MAYRTEDDKPKKPTAIPEDLQLKIYGLLADGNIARWMSWPRELPASLFHECDLKKAGWVLCMRGKVAYRTEDDKVVYKPKPKKPKKAMTPQERKKDRVKRATMRVAADPRMQNVDWTEKDIDEALAKPADPTVLDVGEQIAASPATVMYTPEDFAVLCREKGLVNFV
jgi:hypothetical protein